MKSFSIFLAALVGSVASQGLDSQTVLSGGDERSFSAPGFSLDLNEMRLVQFEHGEPVWITELEKINAKAEGAKFFDITNDRELGSAFGATNIRAKNSFPSNLTQTKYVKSVIDTLSTQGPMANLAKFTSFHTRYYKSETGKQSQQWLLKTIQEITAEQAAPSLKEKQVITITEFPHPWGQNSVIASINGSSKSDELIIISAHQDSTNIWPFLGAPGADDDGSGTVTILEAYRALIASGFAPKRTVEFHWYSAEEGGLLGSQAVAKEYASRGANVIAMSQFDMTAWVKAGTREEVGIITDYVDKDLTEFNKKLVDEYLAIPYVETQCGYACSDHASWSKAGYQSSFTIESTFPNSNKNIHSTSDRIDVSPEFSFEHMLEFSKLAVGYVVELGL